MLASLGNLAAFVVIGWMVLSGVITNAILKDENKKTEQGGCSEKFFTGIKYIFVYLIVFIAPIWLLSILLK